MPLKLTPEQLTVLRALRLFHYRQAKLLHKLAQDKYDEAPQTSRRHTRFAEMHERFVCELDGFFDPEQKAKYDDNPAIRERLNVL